MRRRNLFRQAFSIWHKPIASALRGAGAVVNRSNILNGGRNVDGVFSKLAALSALLWSPLLLLSAPAHAVSIRFEGTGQVGAVSGMGVPPTGSISVGQNLSFGFTFDADAASLLFDGGTNQQSFNLPIDGTGVTIGSFDLTPGTFANGAPAVLTLGTGFMLFPGESQSQAVLNQAFFIPGVPTGNLPFAVGPDARLQFGLISTFRQDLGGAVPTLSNLRDPSQAVFNRFQLVVIEGSRPVGLVTGNFTGSFAAAVPEPSAWGLLILGFGAVGGAMRSRRAGRSLRPA